MSPRLIRATGRTLVAAAAACVVVWTAAIAGLYAAMQQPPDRFGAIMAHVPMASMLVLPFKPLWMSARAGRLHVGDVAPDFSLKPLHGDRAVTLSQEYPRKPVVLIFGSYT